MNLHVSRVSYYITYNIFTLLVKMCAKIWEDVVRKGFDTILLIESCRTVCSTVMAERRSECVVHLEEILLLV